MSSPIDPFIAVHFQDRLELFGGDGTEEVIVELNPAPQAAGLGEEGVRLGASVSPGTQRLDAAAQQALAEEPEVARVISMTRKEQIAVLVRLRNPGLGAALAKVTGFTLNSQLGDIVAGQATEDAIKALGKDPNVISIEASRPASTQGDCMSSIPFVSAPLVHAAPRAETGSEALVGIIDSGIDVLHEAFQTVVPAGQARRTRILAIWDQRSTVPGTPQSAWAAGKTGPAVYSQNYGRYHSAADIDGYLTAGAVPLDLGRNDYPRDGHGTHVTSIAAGSPFSSAGSWKPADNGLAFPGGIAPGAGIVVVIPKMVASPGDPASLGYSVSHVDALAFIKETALALRKPVAVNVSLGMNAGAHDGTSLLELAFDQFSGGGREPGFVVVKSAGNEQTYDGHAQVSVATGSTSRIGWSTTSTPRQQDYLEFWHSSADDLQFTLSFAAPGMALAPLATVSRAAPGQSKALPGGLGVCYLRLERYHHDNGDGRLVVVVRMNQNTALKTAGTWELGITGTSVVTGGTVHGWVERDNSRAVQFTTGATPGCVVSIPGTARTVISVGACDLASPPVAQSFSSQGPGRDGRRKPELAAPGHGIRAAQAATTRGLVPMPGTSMAAPHVTGAVALLLSHSQKQVLEDEANDVPILARRRLLNAAQIRAGLSQCSPHFTGTWDPALGYGCLDVDRLFRAFF